jgi:very-short-patch-repair endonuclease
MPAHQSRSIASTLERAGGVLPSSALNAAGFAHHDLAHAVRRGEVARVRRGWFAAPSADDAVIRAVRVGGALTAGSVAKLRGLWLLDDPMLHVRVPSSAARLRSPDDMTVRLDREAHGVCVHYRSRAATPMLGDRPGRDGLARSLAEMFRCAGIGPAMIALESALNRGALPMQGIESVRALAPAWASRPIDQAVADSDSGLETIARLLFHRMRVPVRAQVHFAGVRRVDLLVGDRLIIELDGWSFHSADQFEIDRKQDLELALRGYLVVRLSYRMVIEDWDRTHRSIRELVARGHHRWRRSVREFDAFDPR